MSIFDDIGDAFTDAANAIAKSDFLAVCENTTALLLKKIEDIEEDIVNAAPDIAEKIIEVAKIKKDILLKIKDLPYDAAFDAIELLKGNPEFKDLQNEMDGILEDLKKIKV